MKRIRLTKKRLAALDYALCLDDILQERMRRYKEVADKVLIRAARYRHILAVDGIKGKDRNVHYALQIVSEQRCPDGTRVLVRLP